jgi:hypothetical protein
MPATTPEAERDRAVSLHLSVPASLVAELRALAARGDRSISREAVRAFRAHVEQAREPEESAA